MVVQHCFLVFENHTDDGVPNVQRVTNHPISKLNTRPLLSTSGNSVIPLKLYETRNHKLPLLATEYLGRFCAYLRLVTFKNTRGSAFVINNMQATSGLPASPVSNKILL